MIILTNAQFYIPGRQLKELESSKAFRQDVQNSFHDTVRFCETEGISASDDTVHVVPKNGSVYLHIISTRKLAYQQHIETGQEQLTDYSDHSYSNSGFNNLNTAMFFHSAKLMFLAAHLFKDGVALSRAQPDDEFYTEYISPVYGIKAKLYRERGDFIVKEFAGCFKILCNGIAKRQYTVPSEIYPVPGSGKTSVYYYDNTTELEESNKIAVLLDAPAPIWDDITDVEIALQVLGQTGYTKRYDMRFYSGWSLSVDGDITPDCWLVVDGRSIIAAKMFGGTRYGKPDKHLYVGVESSPEQAADMRKKLKAGR